MLEHDQVEIELRNCRMEETTMFRKLLAWLCPPKQENCSSLELIRAELKVLLDAVEAHALQCAATENWHELHTLQSLCAWFARQLHYACGNEKRPGEPE